MCRVSLVPVNMMDGIWPFVADGFSNAAKRSGGDLTVGELWVACRGGNAFLFVVQNEKNEITAATVWRSEMWGRGPRFRCLILYGKGFRDWKDELREQIIKVAKLCGANALIADGRVGWRKILPEAKVLRAVYEMTI